MNKKFNTIRYEKDFSIKKIEETRISKVISLIGSGKKVLDLGCGDGFIMERIKEKNNQVFGVEVADVAIKKARAKGFFVYDLLIDGNWSDSIQNKFDIVFGGEIIEHIFDTDNFLQNIKKLLNENGRLILTTPNIASLGRRILLLMGKNPLIEVTARKEDAGHIRYFTRKGLKRLLEENGYEVEKMESSIINLSNRKIIYSPFLAKIFSSLGNDIITVAKR